MGTRPKKPGGEEEPVEDQGRPGEARTEPEAARPEWVASEEVEEAVEDREAGEKDAAEGQVRKSGREAPLPPLHEVSPRHVAYVRGLLSKFGVSPSYEYEDLVQEVLIQASRSLDSPLEPRALLFGITRHLVFRWLAKRDNERVAVQTHLDESDKEGHAPDVEEMWRGAERAHAVHEAIRDLPDIFREVFVRCEIDEVPMPDVARELGIPINTGYTRLHLARARFQEALKRYMARKRIGKDDLAIPIPLALAGAAAGTSDAVLANSAGSTAAGGGAMSAIEGSLSPVKISLFARWYILAANAILVAGAVGALWTVPLGSRTAPTSEPTALPEPSLSTSQSTAAPVQSGSEDAPPALPNAVVVTAPPPREDAPSPSANAHAVKVASAAKTERSEGTWARQIVGLARAGQRATAAAEAEKFVRAFPFSTYRSQIESALKEGAP